jgi:diguanylate cyclase (GGDEF)-like protein
MPAITDIRVVELKVLENLADRTWDFGVSLSEGAGQHTALGLSQQMYADLLLTLIEDGLLRTTAERIRDELENHERRKDMLSRRNVLMRLCTSNVYHEMEVTYRGLRRIDELRDQLRRDRVLEKFGILLDGRYIVSELNYFLERVDGEPISLILADVDDFGQFNLDYGYKAGDAVLRHVFRIIRQIANGRGEAFRQGGEEILIMLPYCEIVEGKALAERICETVEKTPVPYEGKELHVTLSIGVTASPPCNPDGPALETCAEIGLKQAKKFGKNRVIVNVCG